MFAIYHKFGGYLTAENEYTDNPQEAKLYDTREEAEVEVGGYLYRVEEIITQSEE